MLCQFGNWELVAKYSSPDSHFCSRWTCLAFSFLVCRTIKLCSCIFVSLCGIWICDAYAILVLELPAALSCLQQRILAALPIQSLHRSVPKYFSKPSQILYEEQNSFHPCCLWCFPPILQSHQNLRKNRSEWKVKGSSSMYHRSSLFLPCTAQETTAKSPPCLHTREGYKDLSVKITSPAFRRESRHPTCIYLGFEKVSTNS